MMLRSDLYSYYYPNFTDEALLDAVAVLLGDYDAIRKRAAFVLLKIILVKPAFERLMNIIGETAPVVDRNDPRVRVWKNTVLSVGHCEECLSTIDLHAHHIVYWSESPLDRINPKNGRCLCGKCHLKEHKGEGVYHLLASKVGVKGG